MDDREVAALVLASVALADGGCVPCVQHCIDEAVGRAPHLPWESALEDMKPQHQPDLTQAVRNARSLTRQG